MYITTGNYYGVAIMTSWVYEPWLVYLREKNVLKSEIVFGD